MERHPHRSEARRALRTLRDLEDRLLRDWQFVEDRETRRDGAGSHTKRGGSFENAISECRILLPSRAREDALETRSFRKNVRLIVRRHLEQAATWHEKLMGLSRLEEREACLVECAAICQLGSTERCIMERPDDEQLEAPSEPPHIGTFFSACLAIVAVFGVCAAHPVFSFAFVS